MPTTPEPPPRVRAGRIVTGLVHRWWRGEAGAWGLLLDAATAPLELAYRIAARRYHRAFATGRRRVERVGVPVISVGNIAVGGAGKTPVARWLVGELRRRGARPAVLHGGYAADEPALHRAWNPGVPVIVGRDRVAGARAAIAGGASVLVLDDGFQHRRLARDLDLVLVAAETWTTRPRLLPRGPWREAPGALERARIVAVTRKTASAAAAADVADALRRLVPGAQVVQFGLVPGGWRRPGGGRAGGAGPGSAVAVTGIANPEAFLANATAAGARVEEALVFPDHHDYGAADIEWIRRVAGGRAVVTTAKDAVKLQEIVGPELDVWVLEQALEVEAGGSALAAALDAVVG